MRIVIAEDTALLRDGIARLLTDHGHEVTDAVSDAVALLRAVDARHPDLAVIDIRLPPDFTDEGLRAALRIRSGHPDVGVLLLSQYVVHRYATDLLAGNLRGVGYLLKDRVADVRDFLDAVGHVGRGGTVLDPDVVAQLLSRTSKQAAVTRLTERERDVLVLMAQGRSNTAIAGALHTSDSTVEKHVARIFAKLDLAHDPDTNRRVLAVVTYLDS